KAWVATRLDIARHWVMTHAPAGGWKPSTMPKPLFVERFGGVFEHSPWVAEAAFSAGLGAGTNSAPGLHAAMVKAMREGTDEQKRALILAHPDLAGRLALAKQLTADSTKEQASAGLDRLTPAELMEFTRLNEAYKAKFGFPFILAVKARSKEDVVRGFKTRIGNNPTQEFATALDEIERIARLRLGEILPETA
ncbi:MAG: 2-oxo-4-hydroxy-4-carboxy-5-ureidoimidazoline decarboxylase, partial [Methylobacterium sp.]|nr:2-oxo-4-hydroxy-4-carboxy-5-ureidoimidazoline decarboxylase [Methylobacterium sp.]